MPGGVQDHHGGAVDQAVDRGRLQPRRHAALPMGADDLVGMPVAAVGGDPGHAEHGDGGGGTDGPVGGAHRRPLDVRVPGAVCGLTERDPVTRDAPPGPKGCTW